MTLEDKLWLAVIFLLGTAGVLFVALHIQGAGP